MEAGQEFEWNTDGAWSFIYAIDGLVRVGEFELGEGNALALESGVAIVSSGNSTLFLISLQK
ncbi:MAG: hypothetical protein JST80_11855 [Bdellovibrionales bacterium]|nr:hypothetical protein [Bdellovibrionales bacterium]